MTKCRAPYQSLIIAYSLETSIFMVYDMDMQKDDCVFCGIVAGTSPAHTIWEDADHRAFLSIFPNTEGFSVVITKEHLPSYVFDLSDTVLTNLIIAAKQVAKRIDAAFEDVGRTGLILEGFGIDHAHVKLFPMHGTGNMHEWKPIHSAIATYFKKYEGYISSHGGARADDTELANVAEKIRKAS